MKSYFWFQIDILIFPCTFSLPFPSSLNHHCWFLKELILQLIEAPFTNLEKKVISRKAVWKVFLWNQKRFYNGITCKNYFQFQWALLLFCMQCGTLHVGTSERYLLKYQLQNPDTMIWHQLTIHSMLMLINLANLWCFLPRDAEGMQEAKDLTLVSATFSGQRTAHCGSQDSLYFTLMCDS